MGQAQRNAPQTRLDQEPRSEEARHRHKDHLPWQRSDQNTTGLEVPKYKKVNPEWMQKMTPSRRLIHMRAHILEGSKETPKKLCHESQGSSKQITWSITHPMGLIPLH